MHPSKTIEEYAKRLATLSPGFSGADIANLCNEAAILAARKNRDFVESIDFELSSERMLAGLERKKIITPEEKKVIAYHEAGHAVVSWFLKGGNPLLKVNNLFKIKCQQGFNFIYISLKWIKLYFLCSSQLFLEQKDILVFRNICQAKPIWKPKAN